MRENQEMAQEITAKIREHYGLDGEHIAPEDAEDESDLLSLEGLED